MTSERPFRLHLRLVVPATEALARERLDLLRDVTHTYGGEPEALRRVVSLGDEELIWLVLQRFRNSYLLYRSEVDPLQTQILVQALANAKEEGLSWTPVIDELAAARVFSRANRQMARVPFGAPAPPAPFPSEAELVQGLVPWIAAQSEAEPLEDLAHFHANVVLGAIAAHTRVMSPRLFERLACGAEALAQLAKNPNLETVYRNQLAEKVWADYLTHARKKKPGYEMGRASDVLRAFTESPRGLPEGVRREMIKRQRRVARKDERQVEALLADPALTADDAKRILPLLSPKQQAVLLQREVLPDRDARHTLGNAAVATALLEDMALPAEWVHRTASAHVGSREIVRRAAAHPGADLRTLCFIAGLAGDWSDVQLALLRRETLMEDETGRALIMATPHAAVAKALLRSARPDEYPALVRVVLRRSARTALTEIIGSPPPEGTTFPADLVAALLSDCDDRALREEAIGLLGTSIRLARSGAAR